MNIERIRIMKNLGLYLVGSDNQEFIGRYYERMIALEGKPGFEFDGAAYPVNEVEVIREATESELDEQVKQIYGE